MAAKKQQQEVEIKIEWPEDSYRLFLIAQIAAGRSSSPHHYGESVQSAADESVKLADAILARLDT